MELLTSLRTYWTDRWREWSVAERTAISSALVLSLAVTLGVAWWAAQPEYVTLANQLSPSDAAEVVSALDAEGLAYKLNFAGSAVLVPRASLNSARLAIRELLPSVDGAADNELDSGLWADPAVTQVRLQREQEQRLARSIQRVHGVRSATVHLTRPDASPFIRDRGVPKASIVLELQPGLAFSSSDAQAIISLVAHGVEGLNPEHVSVMDTDGRHLSSGGGLQADIAGRIEFRQNLEAQLAAKAETMLAKWIGAGTAVVRVTADVDFTETVRRETTFDPSGKVKLSEQIETTTATTTSPTAIPGGGTRGAGTAANLGSVSGDSTRAAVTSKTEINNTQYDNARVEDTVTEAPGTIRRLTVAAIVQIPASENDADEVSLPDKSAVEAIIKQAVGFDSTRDDGIEVVVTTAPAVTPSLDLPVAGQWEQYERLLRAASLGLAALVAATCGYLVLRRLSPVVVPVPSEEGLSVDAAERLAELSRRARQDPDAAARVLAAWLDLTPNTGTQTRKAA
ncbi:MAG: flagellar M-ring protein FliF [Planctomycetaceae bacterium]|nr:flagellar M-ring protein FliF [Planctomycetaceae bacterium]